MGDLFDLKFCVFGWSCNYAHDGSTYARNTAKVVDDPNVLR